MNAIVELREVRAGYGARTVIRGLSAALPRQQISVVLGPGGSGKSTLLRVLEGSKGDLWWAGGVPSLDAWRLPQQVRDGPDEIGGPEWDLAVKELEDWLRPRDTLSPAMWTGLLSSPAVLMRLTMILRARAEVLLLDEPDQSAQASARVALGGIIRRLRGEGHTIVVVTHHLTFAREIADHVVLLIDGEKLDEGPLTRMQAEPASPRVRDFLTWGT